MKILCICERGNSRSVALAWILKDGMNQEAIAVGLRTMGQETKDLLFRWADRIILVDKRLEFEIPEEFRHKTKVWDVGPDRYFRGFEPELLDMYQHYLNTEGL